ncbi:MAG: tetratricopeptide repeat protein [Thermoanaerobaculia bacterium]
MTDHLRREDLKRNELGEVLGKGIHYAEDHARTLAISLATAVGLALVGAGIWAWISSRNGHANEALAAALRAAEADVVANGAKPDDLDRPSFASASARRDRAEQLFADLLARYGSTGPGRSARMYLAEIAAQKNDLVTARKLWEEYVGGDARSPLGVAAQVNLFALDRQEGKGAELAERLKKMLEQTEKPLPDDLVLYQLAVTYDQLRRPADAKAAYRRIVDEHPQSPYLAVAQQKAGPAEGG